ncbi:MAG: hypothetical protein HC923_13500, partial [Myxococcales bacterium]|nr:hypothetical protein [Myxococcales bacterium]
LRIAVRSARRRRSDLGSACGGQRALRQKVALDYWILIFGQPPGPGDGPAYDQLWRDLMSKHAYRVEGMLHDIIDLEAYGLR